VSAVTGAELSAMI